MHSQTPSAQSVGRLPAIKAQKTSPLPRPLKTSLNIENPGRNLQNIVELSQPRVQARSPSMETANFSMLHMGKTSSSSSSRQAFILARQVGRVFLHLKSPFDRTDVRPSLSRLDRSSLSPYLSSSFLSPLFSLPMRH